jgi:hypothetical protein
MPKATANIEYESDPEYAPEEKEQTFTEQDFKDLTLRAEESTIAKGKTDKAILKMEKNKLLIPAYLQIYAKKFGKKPSPTMTLNANMAFDKLLQYPLKDIEEVGKRYKTHYPLIFNSSQNFKEEYQKQKAKPKQEEKIIIIEGSRFIKKVNARTGEVSYREFKGKTSQALLDQLAEAKRKGLNKSSMIRKNVNIPEVIINEKPQKKQLKIVKKPKEPKEPKAVRKYTKKALSDDEEYKKNFTKEFKKIIGKQKFWNEHTIEEAKELEPLYRNLLATL